MSGASDAELAGLILTSRDTKAFGELVRRHEGLVRNMLSKMTGDRALADDLAQDAFVHAFERLHQFKGTGSFKSWLCRIAYTRFIEATRSRNAALRFANAIGGETASEAQAVFPHHAGIAIDAERALAILAPDERQAVVLCFACDFSHAEAAEVLALPLGTVKSHVSRGRTKLQAFFATNEVAS